MTIQASEYFEVLDKNTDVRARVNHLTEWKAEADKQQALLRARLDRTLMLYKSESTKVGKRRILQLTANLATYRKRFQLLQIQRPFTMTSEQSGYDEISSHLIRQYASLTQAEKLLWLNNFLFLMTADVRKLYLKLDTIKSFQTAGTERNLLISGESGSGKSSALHWYTVHHMPDTVEFGTYMPVVMVEPLEDDKSRKSLLEQIVLYSGDSYEGTDSPLALLTQVTAIFAWCETLLLMVDELNHLATNIQRRQLLSITNKCGGVSIIGSAVNAEQFRETDAELAGRFIDDFPMAIYTDTELFGVLSFADLILPFSSRSGLTQPNFITFFQEKPKGRFGDMMLVIREASHAAILENKSKLEIQDLEKAWKLIQLEKKRGK